MHAPAEFIHTVERPMRRRIASGHMVTVVRKFLTWREARRFSDNLVALDHQAAAVRVLDHPFPAQQRDGMVGSVANRNEVNERVRLVDGQGGSAVMVVELVEAGDEAG
jgi:hypothetical protein